MFLEKDEVVKLTGYVHASKQKKVLDQMGVPHKLRESDNMLLVLSADVVAMMRDSQSKPAPTPEPAAETIEADGPGVIATESLPGFVS